MRVFVPLMVAASMIACSSEPSSAPAVRVVVLQDGSFPDARDLVSPAVLGLQLALSQAPSTGLHVLDTGGDAARTLVAARAAAADPSVVATVVAPFTAMPAEATDSLLAAGIPVLSLSSLAEPPSGRARPAWRRFVAPISVSARALVRVAGNLHRRHPVCVLGEDTSWSERLRAIIDGARTGVRTRSITSSPTEAAKAIEAEGCRAAVWTGTAPGAEALRRSSEEGFALVLDDAARTDGYLVLLWPAASTTLAVCSCADLSVSADPDAQRFVHDYQSSTGLDAGPFAVEGFDVGTWIVRALQGGATRGHLAVRLASTNRFSGLARAYRWDDRSGIRDEGGVRVYRAVGVRWLVALRPERAL